MINVSNILQHDHQIVKRLGKNSTRISKIKPITDKCNWKDIIHMKELFCEIWKK